MKENKILTRQTLYCLPPIWLCIVRMRRLCIAATKAIYMCVCVGGV